MLSALLPLMLSTGVAQAQSFTVSPSAVLLGVSAPEVRPGLRVGFEPIPELALEVFGDVGFNGGDQPANMSVAGAISGRAWLVGDGFTGAYLVGRGAIGMSSWLTYAANDPVRYGPLVGVYGGFGGRPVPWLNLEALTGPELSVGGYRIGSDRTALRTEMTASIVINLDAGSGNVKHRPTRKVK